MSHINVIEKYEEHRLVIYNLLSSILGCFAIIIIAVSIEALLMIFKFALNGGGEHIIEAVWIIIAAALLLVSLGVYVFLGSKTEGMLFKNNGNTRKRHEKGV